IVFFRNYYRFFNLSIKMTNTPLDFSLDLMRRLPPNKLEENLGDVISLCPDITEDLLSSVDQPLKIKIDPVTKKEYLICDYNRDGDSYRCPWSNKYDPPLEDGNLPSDELRNLEIEMNAAFEVYKDLYYHGGVSSVYLWDAEHGFAGIILFKKKNAGGLLQNGSWDSIHVIQAIERSARQYSYKIISTVLLWFETNSDSGEMSMGGSYTRNIDHTFIFGEDTTQLSCIGKLIEDQENKIRDLLKNVYFSKTSNIIGELRQPYDRINDETKQEFISELSSNLHTRKNPTPIGNAER
uniref:F-actin-capping protein subunit beta n=1 Tax=Strongyloides stercoralis TaxID=6248 RepID=A0AAF5DLU8_STRER